MSWSLRLAVPADAERIAEIVREGFEGYRAFAPAGWEPPDPALELATVRDRLANPDVWCLMAEADGALAGHVALMPATQHGHFPSNDGTLAHLWQLFVRPRWQGSGVAAVLHREALREAETLGFTAMRLYTPAAQARARRFYEREGWTAAGPPFDDRAFGMPLVEYRRAISSSV